jgi:hypothetical protein
MPPENLRDRLRGPQVIHRPYQQVMYVVHHLHIESWLMLPKAHSQGKFTPAGAPNMFGVGMSAGPTLKGPTLVGRFIEFLPSQHMYAYVCYQPEVWGVHDTSIEEERVHFFHSKCERPVTVAGQECVPFQHQGLGSHHPVVLGMS